MLGAPQGLWTWLPELSVAGQSMDFQNLDPPVTWELSVLSVKCRQAHTLFPGEEVTQAHRASPS